jgi:hypothetical protein
VNDARELGRSASGRGHFMKGAAVVRSVARFMTALVVASIAGEIVAVPAAFFVDIVVGGNVTGGRWPLNVENVVVVCFKGLAIGCIAGSIVKKRGMLVGALAAFVPLWFFITVSLIMNRDPTAMIAAQYDTKPAVWSWIALAPAMISGHFAAKAASAHGRGFVLYVVGLGFLAGAGIGSALIHLYTGYIAYQEIGLFAALLTLSMPPLSEIVWFIILWHDTGVVLNLYTLRLLAWGLLILIGVVMLFSVVKRTKRSHLSFGLDEAKHPEDRRHTDRMGTLSRFTRARG